MIKINKQKIIAQCIRIMDDLGINSDLYKFDSISTDPLSDDLHLIVFCYKNHTLQFTDVYLDDDCKILQSNSPVFV